MALKVIDLNEENERFYFVCLEDWSEEVKQGGNHKELWYRAMKERGLRVKLALDDRGQVGGMIQYIPIEYSNAIGRDLYFVNCIWVHGHKQGRGNFQKQGMGKALLGSAEEDVKGLGKKGLVTWGVSMPFWMRAKWFKKQGYAEVDRDAGLVLMWKPFLDGAERPSWMRPTKTPTTTPGKVTVTAFLSGWCLAYNIVFENAKKAAAEFGDSVVFKEVSMLDRGNIAEWRFSDALFIDGKRVRTGPPPSYEKIKKMIAKKVKKLPRV